MVKKSTKGKNMVLWSYGQKNTKGKIWLDGPMVNFKGTLKK